MPETVSITVGAIAHLASNGSAIFSGVNAAGSRIRVVAGVRSLPRQPIVGEAWEITGEFREHPKYGRQLYATCGHYSIPKGRLIVN